MKFSHKILKNTDELMIIANAMDSDLPETANKIRKLALNILKDTNDYMDEISTELKKVIDK